MLALCQTKVRNNAVEITLFSEQNILRFKITMHDFFLMHDFQSFEDTFHDHFDFSLSKFVSIFDFVVELSSLKQLNNDIDWVLALVNLEYFH